MRLVSLTSNMESFKEVEFHQKGVTLIVGTSTGDAKKTFNGVGKSLLVELIHYCLGASRNPVLEKHLPGWEFILTFSIGQTIHVAKRATDDASKIVLDGKKLGQRAFNLKLGELAMDLGEPSIPNLTFRSIFQHFVRRDKFGYNDPLVVRRGDKDFDIQFRAAYLLGLDPTLCNDKKDLKARLDGLKKRRSEFQADDVMKSYFGDSAGAPDVARRDLEEKSAALQAKLDSFKVAHDYTQVELDADQVRTLLQVARNRSTRLRHALSGIEQSLQLPTDVTPEEVAAAFAEADVFLPDLVVKRLEEVANFHQRLLASRRKRLVSEKTRLKKELGVAEGRIEALSAELDKAIQYLGAHGALDEFTELNRKLADLRTQAARLGELEGLERDYKTRERECRQMFLTKDAETETHLEAMSASIQSFNEEFRRMARRFYPDKAAAVSVKNHEGENQLRFDVNVHIQDDASDGIGEVKLFCFDMSLMSNTKVHGIEFLMHDSRLFANMDPRQRGEAMRLAMESPYQYIATVNEDQLDSMYANLTEEEALKLEKRIKLRLTDESAATKLLGIEVDMRYWARR